MPHKKAKRSIREEQRSHGGSDLDPGKQTLSNEAIPKSIARILYAESIRTTWKEKKRKAQDDEGGDDRPGKRRRKDGDTNPKKEQKEQKKKILNNKTVEKRATLGIQPGESLAHFNKRVETDMRPIVASAVQSSRLTEREVRRVEVEEKLAKRKKLTVATIAEPTSPPHSSSKHTERPKDFKKASTSAPRRLNDIAQAPPELNALPRGAVRKTAAGDLPRKNEGVVSMAQRVIMEKERERVVAHYRQLKERKIKEKMGDIDEHA